MSTETPMERLLRVISDAEHIDTTTTDSKAKSMEGILRSFNEAFDPTIADSSVQPAQYMGNQKLGIGAFVVEKTPDGYQLSEMSGRFLMSDITLYETAYTVATYLRQGCVYNSSPVINLLHDDSRYTKHLNEAKDNQELFNKYKHDKMFGRMDLMATKFEENKFRANRFKNKILTKYNALGK